MEYTLGSLMVIAGASPADKGLFAPLFGHYGRTVAVVSAAHEYSHKPDYAAQVAAADARRLAACWNYCQGITTQELEAKSSQAACA